MKTILRTILFLIVSTCATIVIFTSPSYSAIVAAANTTENENLNIDELKYEIPVKDNKLEAIGKSSYISVSSAGILAREKIYNRASYFKVYVKSSSSDVKAVYTELESVIYAETDKVDQGDYMLWNVDKVSASYGASKSQSTYYYTFKMNVEYLMTEKQQNEVLEKADSIISTLKITNSMSEYDRIKKIYDYICKNVYYVNDSTDIKYSTYGALINQKTVCQGYASAFYLLARKAGLSVRLIPGTVTYNGEQHGWNIVKIGNYYYNLDSTWDSDLLHEGKTYKYFLRGDSFPGHKRWDAYSTSEFYTNYPMAASPYGKGDATASDKTLKAAFQIIKPKWKKVTRKKATVKKVSGANGYQIKYSTKKNFKKKYTTTVTIKKTKYKFKKLKKKKYYVKFRAFRKFSGSKVYTKWSKKKKI